MNDDKNSRRFRTMDEIKEDYNEEDHDLASNTKDVLGNLKREIFSPWGIMIMCALAVSVLSGVMR